MPPNTVSVARPTKWGNIWRVGLVACACRSVGECDHNAFRCQSAAHAVDAYRWLITNGRRLRQQISELRGKNLACWCPPSQPCHADVLLELANRPLTCDAADA